MKKIICTVLLALAIVFTAMGTSAFAAESLEITLQPQNPTFPEYSVATYTVTATGQDLKCDWFLVFEGETYLISDTSGSAQPWEGYAGETYGARQDDNTFTYFFGGIGPELSGAKIYCEINDGHFSVTSDVAIISVGGDGMPPATYVPAMVILDQGEQYGLYCKAVAPNGEALRYEWYETGTAHLEDIISINRGAETTDTLMVDTSAPGTRYYVCSVDAMGAGTAYTSVIPVIVLESQPTSADPEIYTEDLPNAVSDEYYSFYLECSDPNATFEIYYNPGRPNEFLPTGLELSNHGEFWGTAQAPGEYTFTVCAFCENGEAYKQFTLVIEEPAAPHSHSFCEWMVTTQPTCTEEGIRVRECDCGKEEHETIPTLEHSWDEGQVTTQPTAAKEGVKTFTCTDCGQVRTETIPAEGGRPSQAGKDKGGKNQPTAAGTANDDSTADSTTKDEPKDESEAGPKADEKKVSTNPEIEKGGMPLWTIAPISVGGAGAGVGVMYLVKYLAKRKGK